MTNNNSSLVEKLFKKLEQMDFFPLGNNEFEFHNCDCNILQTDTHIEILFKTGNIVKLTPLTKNEILLEYFDKRDTVKPLNTEKIQTTEETFQNSLLLENAIFKIASIQGKILDTQRRIAAMNES